MSGLLSEIEVFCVQAGLSETRFGELALNDKPFVTQLRAGRDVRMSTVAKVREFMAGWPAEGGKGEGAAHGLPDTAATTAPSPGKAETISPLRQAQGDRILGEEAR